MREDILYIITSTFVCMRKAILGSGLPGCHRQEKLPGNPAAGGGDRLITAATTLSRTRQFLGENRPSNVNFTAEAAGDSAAVFETISSSSAAGSGYREPDSAARGKLKPMSA